jgi:hypothetical protein
MRDDVILIFIFRSKSALLPPLDGLGYSGALGVLRVT